MHRLLVSSTLSEANAMTTITTSVGAVDCIATRQRHQVMLTHVQHMNQS